MKVQFTKMNPTVITPTRTDGNAGFDIYTTETTPIILYPGEGHMFPTGLKLAVEKGYYAQVFDRGSTGSKGIHTHCGVIDSNYRGEVFIALRNTNTKIILFGKDENAEQLRKEYGKDNVIVYPLTKAIAQIVILPVPEVEMEEITQEHFAQLTTDRGEGKLGSSGK